MTEEQQRRLRGPVDVVEHEHQTRRLGGRGEPRVDRLEHAVLLDLGVAGDGAVAEVAEPGRDVGNEPRQLRRVRPELGAVLGPEMCHVVAERLDERLVRDAELLVAAAEEHDGAALVGAAERTRTRAGSSPCPAPPRAAHTLSRCS